MTILPEGAPVNDSDQVEAENTHRLLVSLMAQWVNRLEKQRALADDDLRDTVIEFDLLPMSPEKQNPGYLAMTLPD